MPDPILTAENVRVAVTGAVYGGPITAAIPTSATSATTGYTDYGYVSEDGVEEATDRSVDKLKAWQNAAVVRTVVTEGVMSYKLSLIESTKPVIELFYGSMMDAAGKIVVDPTSTGGPKNFILDVIDGPAYIRASFRGEVGETEAQKNASGEIIGYGVTINVIGKVTKWYSTLAGPQVPTVSAASPTGAAAGALVNITGTGFTGVVAGGVKFGTVAASNISVVSDSSIVATVPAGSAGAANITVTNPTGASTAFPYTRG